MMCNHVLNILEAKSISTGASKFIAGSSILGAPVRPPLKLGPVSHTGVPKTSPTIFGKIYKNHQFIDI
jgi:hypothetical protein